MKQKISITIDGKHAQINVTDEVANRYADLKNEDPSLSNFEALKEAKQSIEGITILSKDEAWQVFQRNLKQKEIETGKCQMEIFREMEFRLSQKEEGNLTVSERIMLQALRDVDQKFYGNS
ncbi:hypothetical protein [uncultured Draconibacterium sp.]|uniref:hypothetical protein n=1 Tax=uncultured Draconibacterium sp. TaxID=1573823 RepID=UPI0032172197